MRKLFMMQELSGICHATTTAVSMAAKDDRDVGSLLLKWLQAIDCRPQNAVNYLNCSTDVGSKSCQEFDNVLIHVVESSQFSTLAHLTTCILTIGTLYIPIYGNPV